MREAGVIRFLRAMGVQQVYRDGLPWIRSTCPLASALHEDGKDVHPSFGVKVNNNGESLYHCFACGGGLLIRLLHNLFVCGLPYEEATRVYTECEIFDVENVLAGKEVSVVESEAERSPVPADVLERLPLVTTSSYETERCRGYLSQRGISFEVQEKFQLRCYSSMQSIVFPRIDEKGTVWALRARSRKFKSYYSISPTFLNDERKWGDYSTWFGAQCLSSGAIPLLVESETDVLRLHSLGIKDVIPIACCGCIQKRQLARLYQDVMVLGFDADIAGKRNFQRACGVLRGAVLFGLDWGIVGKNDAGGLKDLEEFNEVWRSRKMLPLGGGGGSV